MEGIFVVLILFIIAFILIKKDVRKIFKDVNNELKEKAEKGDIESQSLLGALYEVGGEEIKQDYQKAIYWYTKAAEQGNEIAQNRLGHMYELGTGVEQDYQKAIYWYTKAAEQGDEDSKKSLQEVYNLLNSK